MRIHHCTTRDYFLSFCNDIVEIFEDGYLRAPRADDVKTYLALNAARGFPGIYCCVNLVYRFCSYAVVLSAMPSSSRDVWFHRLHTLDMVRNLLLVSFMTWSGLDINVTLCPSLSFCRKNCPIMWQGQYTDRHKDVTVAAEAVATYDLR